MTKPQKHILVCASFRTAGPHRGVCHSKGSLGLLQYLESELSDRGLSGVNVSSTGCLKACDRGPVMVVYPDNVWYGGIESEADVDALIDALASGKTVKERELS